MLSMIYFTAVMTYLAIDTSVIDVTFVLLYKRTYKRQAEIRPNYVQIDISLGGDSTNVVYRIN